MFINLLKTKSQNFELIKLMAEVGEVKKCLKTIAKLHVPLIAVVTNGTTK
jgi:hypothetical protein